MLSTAMNVVVLGWRTSVPDYLLEPFYNFNQFLLAGSRHALADSLDSECADLTDLYPGPLGKLPRRQLERQGEPSALGLARDGDGDHGA